MGGLGSALQGKAYGDSRQVQDVPAQESSHVQRVHHFNSDGTKLQEDCAAGNSGGYRALKEGIDAGARIILPCGCPTGGY
jgi:hypothetical protein